MIVHYTSIQIFAFKTLKINKSQNKPQVHDWNMFKYFFLLLFTSCSFISCESDFWISKKSRPRDRFLERRNHWKNQSRQQTSTTTSTYQPPVASEIFNNVSFNLPESGKRTRFTNRDKRCKLLWVFHPSRNCFSYNHSFAVFNLFTFVTFDNNLCGPDNGTCITQSECAQRLGRVTGPCANGYGACCLGINFFDFQ